MRITSAAYIFIGGDFVSLFSGGFLLNDRPDLASVATASINCTMLSSYIAVPSSTVFAVATTQKPKNLSENRSHENY